MARYFDSDENAHADPHRDSKRGCAGLQTAARGSGLFRNALRRYVQDQDFFCAPEPDQYNLCMAPFSIRYRIQRITKESASVAVPITGDLLTDERRIDTAKAKQLAIRLGLDPSTQWEVDGEPVVSIHPLQLPPLD